MTTPETQTSSGGEREGQTSNWFGVFGRERGERGYCPPKLKPPTPSPLPSQEKTMCSNSVLYLMFSPVQCASRLEAGCAWAGLCSGLGVLAVQNPSLTLAAFRRPLEQTPGPPCPININIYIYIYMILQFVSFFLCFFPFGANPHP